MWVKTKDRTPEMDCCSSKYIRIKRHENTEVETVLFYNTWGSGINILDKNDKYLDIFEDIDEWYDGDIPENKTPEAIL